MGLGIGAKVPPSLPRAAFNNGKCRQKCGIVLLVHIIQIPQTAVAYFGAWTMEAKPRLTRRIKRSHIVG